MAILIILVVLLIGVGFYIASTYNFFVSSKARIKASIQEIGNQLKRQADLIPNLESSAKGYLKHEKSIFKDLTDARKQIAGAVESGDLGKIDEAANKLSSVMGSLKIAVEDNPEIKADSVVNKLMDELRDTADKIMYSRRLLIDLTADYNVKRVRFPSSIVASMFKFDEMKGLDTPVSGEHIEVSEKDTKTPKVDLN